MLVIILKINLFIKLCFFKFENFDLFIYIGFSEFKNFGFIFFFYFF